jgi:hypothetical protein
MDNACEILSQVRAPSRLAFTPRYNHHIDGAQGRNLPAWMDWQLRGGRPFPAVPKLELRVGHDGDPLAYVQPADESQVTDVEVFYTLGEKPPPNRFWRRAETLKSKRSWQARLPVLKTGDPLRAFANVSYRSGVCLSTNLTRSIPDRLGATRASLAWSASPAPEPTVPGAPFVFATANTDPNVSPAYFLKSDDPSRPEAVCINLAVFGKRINLAIVSHYIGDPAYTGHEGDLLTFEYQGEFLRDTQSKADGSPSANDPGGPGFTILLIAHDWTPRAQKYMARVSTTGPATAWRQVSLSARHFVAADGKPLPRWRDLDKIEIRGIGSKQNPPRFARFRWAVR